MGGEGAYLIFLFPVLLGVMALILIAVVPTDKGITRPRMLGLGRRRIAAGYLGAILVNTLLVAGHSYFDAHSSGVPQMVLSWSLFLATTTTPFVVLGLSAFVLPMLALLRLWNLGTALWLVIVTVTAIGLLSLLFLRFPDNLWCERNPWTCVWRWGSALTLPAIAAVLGFAAFARLPVVRAMPRP